jgi:CheY-like chemotaxis protein
VAIANNPFFILERTVNVLVVDDMPEIREMVGGLLDLFGIYSVHRAESTKDAFEIIAQFPKRFHACLFDLGLNDVEGNELHLLEKFGKTIPFIIMSATEDTEKAFECKNKGGKTFVKKATPQFNSKLVSGLNKYALINLICPGYERNEGSVLTKCVDALEETNPHNVSDWAQEVGVIEVRMRKECEQQMTVKPKQALCVFHVFSGMFKHIEKTFDDKSSMGRFDADECGKALMDSIAYKKEFEYYLANRQEIDPLIFGRLPLPPTR